MHRDEAMTEKSKDKKTEAAGKSQQAKEADGLEKALKERDEARAKADEYLDMARRLQADFENYRKRTERDNEEYRKYATKGVVSQLLNVVDDLDRALQSAKKDDPLAAGVAGIGANLRKILKDEGVEEIPCDGRFDPDKQEAMMVVDGDEDGMVAAVFQKGYTMHGKVVRFAKVSVTRKAEAAPKEQPAEPEKEKTPASEPEKTDKTA